MRVILSVSTLALVCMAGVVWAQAPYGPALDGLHAGTPQLREHAAARLGLIGDRSSVPALVGALVDPHSGVRREAAKALGFLKDARAVPSLIRALADHDVNVRFYAAYALGEISDPSAADALLRALRDPAWCVRDQAAWALREIGDAKIAEAVVAELQDRAADVPHLVWLLQHLPHPQTCHRVASLLDDADPALRRRAVLVLQALGGEAVVEPLVGALADRDPQIRCAAAQALVAVAGKRARQPLEQLADTEKDAAVREAVNEALERISQQGQLAAWWSFDDRNTETAKDVTGHGNDGQVLRAQAADGKVGAALRFGDGSYVELGRPAGLPIAGRTATIVAWAHPEADNGVVVARGGAFCGFSLYVKDGLPKFGIHRTQDGPGYLAAGNQRVVGSWVHLAGVIRQDRIELYVNGKRAAAAKTPGPIPNNCGQGMEIGFDTNNSPAEITVPFEGIIDEVKMYLTDLDQEDIADLYQRGANDETE